MLATVNLHFLVLCWLGAVALSVSPHRTVRIGGIIIVIACLGEMAEATGGSPKLAVQILCGPSAALVVGLVVFELRKLWQKRKTTVSVEDKE